LGKVEDLAAAGGGEGGDAVVGGEFRVQGSGVRVDSEGNCGGELFEFSAGEEADVFSKRAETARVDAQAVALDVCDSSGGVDGSAVNGIRSCRGTGFPGLGRVSA